MSLEDRQAITDALRELSDRALQERLWLSDGKGGADVSSFSEVVEQLFTDTGLSEALESGTTGFGAETQATFNLLESALRKVNQTGGPARTIDSLPMTEVRAVAGRLLELLEPAS
jgi:hypothetical protein